jgi:phosphatidylglycerophosphatase A
MMDPAAPDQRPWKRKLVLAAATGFGLGFSPFAPGTMGSLLGIPIALWLTRLPVQRQVFWAIVMVLAAVAICDAAERILKTKDDRRIVADEYLTFPVCLIGIPWCEMPWLLAFAFVANRALDIVKPFPAYRSQKLPGGIGIVADDLIACLYGLAINHVVYRVVVGMVG